ncbi:Immunoglobulin-like domain [Trinorchestia longiramus]|nr:Immunoglobulin-like domain [Trinorchestia longiramus]
MDVRRPNKRCHRRWSLSPNQPPIIAPLMLGLIGPSPPTHLSPSSYPIDRCVWSSGAFGARREEALDVLEGRDITLECHFSNPRLLSGVIYWMRHRNGEVDNVAFGDQALDASYRINYVESESRYDLTINRATYDRDNGMFECRSVKEGSGSVLHNTVVNLTVLIPPGSPHVYPQKPKAVEGKPVELTCSSRGGSPDPQIIWYRTGSDEKLRSVLKPGGGRDEATTSVLTISPTKDDHGNEYRCVVSNRALAEGEKMETSVVLDVDYYPRITIGPANPMRVERGAPATLSCDVDAKPPVKNVRWTRGKKFIDIRKTLVIDTATEEYAGRYICQADNGLGILREREVTLDVLYGPIVTVPASRDLEEGQNLVITCNVTANPAPRIIEWYKVDDESFRQSGDILRINSVTAANQGDYVCRAVNFLAPTNQDGSDRIGNATVAVRIHHAPGKTFIKLSTPVAVLDESVILTCGSNPPGWPTPRYEWRRHDSDTPLIIGPNYTIPKASYADEGTYTCQPSNRLGKGSKASMPLKVYQAPSILESLPETTVESIGTTDVSLTCRAQGKPEPSVRWMKDGEEINPAEGLYDVAVQQSALGSNGVYTVQSKLMFQGSKRRNSNQIMAKDRGIYECMFKNEVREVGTSLFLRVKHAPITVHKNSKVAYDVGEDAVLVCLMQSFPNPSFQWFRGSSMIHRSDPHFSTNETSLPEDVYSSQLFISDVNEEDYGDYTCKGENTIGEHKTTLKLQPKGPPEPPVAVRLVSMGTNSLEIEWEEGFNGGIERTKFIAFIESELGSKQEYDCQYQNPCLIGNLEEQTAYRIQVLANNIKGVSGLSAPLQVSTGVEAASIPVPDQVYFELLNQVVSFRVRPTNLLLVGQIKKKPEASSEWEVISTEFPLSGKEYEEISVDEKYPEEVQVRFCAVGFDMLCGPYVQAKKVDVLPARAIKSSGLQYWVGIVIGCVVVFALIAIVVMCCCRHRKGSKLKKKAGDMEVSHRGVSSQAPPPPYYTVGRDNKAMDGSLQNGMEDGSKAAIYTSQQPFTYGQVPPNQQNNNGLGYMDNSYSNSNNGGSVNSQDSLWQVKNSGVNNGNYDPNTNSAQPPQMTPGSDPRYPQYDPMLHGGYGLSGYGDYSHYPPSSPHQTPVPHQMQMPPHQQPLMGKDDNGYYPGVHQQNGGYTANGDAYASVQKPRKRMDHVDGYDVSGMPNPYMEHQMDPNMGGLHDNMVPPQDNKPQISFDESLESGYSTPNSRNRRIIREIIV